MVKDDLKPDDRFITLGETYRVLRIIDKWNLFVLRERDNVTCMCWDYPDHVGKWLPSEKEEE